MSSTTRLEIEGMSCATCVGNVEDAVGDLDGVDEVSANFASDEGSVTYDPETVSLGEIYEAVEHAGYEPVRERLSVEVGGMSCATCSAAVADATEAVPGVIESSVNFAADEATIEYNPVETDRSAIDDAIEEAGYEPVRPAEGDESEAGEAAGERKSVAQREMQKQWKLVVFGGVLTAPFLLVMVDMFGGNIVPDSVA
ncbi:MAG: copper ion binding protein, partial [Halohasta sp.]